MDADRRQRECTQAEQGADDVHEQHRLFLTEAVCEKAVVQMSLVGLEDRAVVARAPHNGKRRVEDRQAERENRHDEGDGRRALDRTDDGDARKHEAEEHTPRVAHKDARRVEVVVEEAHRRSRECNGNHGDGRNALLHGDEEDRQRRDGGYPRRQPVQSVDEVDGIRQPNDPENRRRNRKELKVDIVAERVGDDINAYIESDDDHGRRNDLPEQLHLCRQVAVVIDDADGDDDRAADHESDKTRHVLGCKVDEGELDENRHHERRIDADAADARDGAHVHLARIGLVECPRAACKGDHSGGQQECHAERDQKG